MAEMSSWFRLYSEVLDDPKVQRLPPDLFKVWVNLMCLACKQGGALGNVEDVSFSLRLDVQTVRLQVADLTERGLIDESRKGLAPHNWGKRQYKSDTSTDRVKRFRERSTKQDETVSRNVSVTLVETAPDTDTDTEKNRKKDAAKAAPTDVQSLCRQAAVRLGRPSAVNELLKAKKSWQDIGGLLGRAEAATDPPTYLAKAINRAKAGGEDEICPPGIYGNIL